MDQKLKNVQSKHKETEGPAEKNDSELALIKEELKDKISKLTVAEKNLMIANSKVQAQETSMRDANDEIKKLNSELILVKEHLKASEAAIRGKESYCKKLEEDLNAEKETIKGKDSELSKAKQELEDEKETTKRMTSDLNKTKQDLEAEKVTIKRMGSELTKAKQDLAAEKVTIKRMGSELTKAKQDLEAEKVTMGSELTKAKQDLVAAETKFKDKEFEWTKVNKEQKRKGEALEMDLTLPAKDIDGLSWLLFSVKFALEACLAALEFLANREHMNFLIASIVITFLALLLNGWEVVRSCKEKKVFVNSKIKWSRVPWLPEIYSFVIILLELSFYILKLWITKPVHVSPYTCIFHSCILAQKLTLKYKLKAAARASMDKEMANLD